MKKRAKARHKAASQRASSARRLGMGALALTVLLGASLIPAPQETEAAWTDTASMATTPKLCSRVWNWNVYMDIAGVGDWDGDGHNDVVALWNDGTLQLHPGRGNGQFDCPIVMGAAPANTRSITGLELSAGRGPTLFAVTSGVSPNGRTNAAYTATPAMRGVTGKRQAVSSWQEDYNYGWNIFESGSLIAAPLLERGQSTLVAKWSRTGLSNFFAYRINAMNMVVNVVGNPSDHDAEPGTYGWDEWYPGDSIIGLGDWDGDGYGDIGAVTGPNGPGGTVGRMVIYRGDGTGGRGLAMASFDAGVGWSGFVKREGGWDYTGDGRPDIIGIEASTGRLMLWRWIGAGQPAAPVRTY